MKNTAYICNTLLLKCHALKKYVNGKMVQNDHDFSLFCERSQQCEVKID